MRWYFNHIKGLNFRVYCHFLPKSALVKTYRIYLSYVYVAVPISWEIHIKVVNFQVYYHFPPKSVLVKQYITYLSQVYVYAPLFGTKLGKWFVPFSNLWKFRTTSIFDLQYGKNRGLSLVYLNHFMPTDFNIRPQQELQYRKICRSSPSFANRVTRPPPQHKIQFLPQYFFSCTKTTTIRKYRQKIRWPPTDTGKCRRRLSCRYVIRKTTRYVFPLDLPSCRDIADEDDTEAVGYDICDSESHPENNANEYANKISDLDNIFIGNTFHHASPMAIGNSTKRSLDNDLKEIGTHAIRGWHPTLT